MTIQTTANRNLPAEHYCCCCFSLNRHYYHLPSRPPLSPASNVYNTNTLQATKSKSSVSTTIVSSGTTTSTTTTATTPPLTTISMHPSLPMSARTGRTTARYTPGTNRRLCAGVVAISTLSTQDSPGHHTHVLVTSSSRHPDRYVLPKGGWEQDETAEQAALREGWEEGIFPRPPVSALSPSCSFLSLSLFFFTTFLYACLC